MPVRPRHEASARLRRGLLAIVAILLAALVAGWAMNGAASEVAEAEDPTDTGSGKEATAPRECETPEPEPVPTPDPARGEPVHLVIPRIDVDATVVPISMGTDNALVPPSDYTQAGWWSSSALPGSVRGTTLIAGHTVKRGDGVFDDLGDLESGDVIRVRTDSGWVRYRVVKVADLDTEQLSSTSERLFSQDTDGRLVLVTCSDYRLGSYRANTVVIAKPEAAAL